MYRRPPAFHPGKAGSLQPKIQMYTGPALAELPQLEGLPEETRRDIRVVAHVLPFKVNNYVVKELINWNNIPDDPIFRLTFPHRDMLPQDGFNRIADLLDRNADQRKIKRAADMVRMQLNPHPAGQTDKNVPEMDGKKLWGMQHKYRETALFFPAQGQTCHSYCAYCFRWAQFIGIRNLKFAARDAALLAEYVRRHESVTDVLFTGGDPMVMSTKFLRMYIEPLRTGELEHLRNIRIGTKSLAYWPYRFLSDRDADSFIRLVEECVSAGKHIAIIAHFSHYNELDTPVVEKAIRRLRDAGAEVRCQAPVVRYVNDSPEVWRLMWTRQVRLGCIPYYMFVERDTGAKSYFALPLVKAYEIYRDALADAPGLARTVRGPSMSATPGKINVDGIAEINGEKVFCLRFLQARNPQWVDRPFFAAFDDQAIWLNDLKPAFGEHKFFFETDDIQSWRQLDAV